MLTEVLLLLRSSTDLLKNKSRPEAAAQEAAAWVQSERAMREKLKREREARELKEKLEVSYPIQIDYRDPVPIRRPPLVCAGPPWAAALDATTPAVDARRHLHVL